MERGSASRACLNFLYVPLPQHANTQLQVKAAVSKAATKVKGEETKAKKVAKPKTATK